MPCSRSCIHHCCRKSLSRPAARGAGGMAERLIRLETGSGIIHNLSDYSSVGIYFHYFCTLLFRTFYLRACMDLQGAGRAWIFQINAFEKTYVNSSGRSCFWIGLFCAVYEAAGMQDPEKDCMLQKTGRGFVFTHKASAEKPVRARGRSCDDHIFWRKMNDKRTL